MKKLMSTVVLSVLSACLIPNIALAQQDGEYLQIVKVAPIYPPRAAQQGIQGYVIVEYTVTVEGTVEDVTVVESSSPLFDRAAVVAAAKYRYKPKVVDGQPEAVTGVRTKITWELAD